MSSPSLADRLPTVLAYLQYIYAHSAAFIGMLGALILLLQGNTTEALAAFLAALAALSDPRKPAQQ